MVSKFLARQFAKPSGIIGPLLLGPVWNRRNRALNDSALGLLDLEPDDEVLEVGFGGGYLLGRALARVTQGHVAGIDVSEAMTEHCRRRYRREWLSGHLQLDCASVSQIPFADNRFNKVYSVNSLFYWPDVPAAIREFGRVTREGGRLVLVFTSRASLKGLSFARHGLSLLDGSDVGRLLQDGGFEVTRIDEATDRHRSYSRVVGTRHSW